MNKLNRQLTRRAQKVKDILTKSVEEDFSPVLNDKLDDLLLKNELDTDYEEAFREIYRTGARIHSQPSRECLDTLEEVKDKLGMEQLRKVPLYRRTYFRIASAAAVVLLVAAMSLTLLNRGNQDPGTTGLTVISEHKVEAIEGVQKDIVLADNTKVWISGNSKITYPETFGEERNVKLEGKARFDVEYDNARPFTVHTEHLEIRVLGTNFDVTENSELQITEVVLYEGSVEVLAGKLTEMMVPGEKLTYNYATATMELEKVVVENIEDWRSDAIFTHGKTMPQLLLMVENYYEIGILFDTVQFDENQRYSFGFDKTDNIETVMTVLSRMGEGFKYEITGNIIYITN